MRVTVLVTRTAPATIRELVSRVVRKPAEPSEIIRRQQIPYWEERGWTRQGNVYIGTYQTPYGAFCGEVHVRGSRMFEFFLYEPSKEIRSHSHWVCFQIRANGWYLVHMGKAPHDVSSGILRIERLITESYEQA